MNNLLRMSLYKNNHLALYCFVVSVITTLFIIGCANIEKNALSFNFSAICSMTIALSLTFISFSDDIRNKWCSYLVSYNNDRRGLLFSMTAVFYSNILICVVTVLLILMLYDYATMRTIVPTFITTVALSSFIFSTSLFVYTSTGRCTAFALSIPAMAITGCILTFISVVQPSAPLFDSYVAITAAIASILIIISSFVTIGKTDL